MTTIYGKLLNEPNAEYHANAAVSKTKIGIFRRSAKLYYKLHVAKTLVKPAATDALLIGSAVDTLALEGPEAYAKLFIESPKDAPKRPTKAQRNAARPSPESRAAMDWWDQFAMAAEGKSVIDAETAATVRRCADALNENATFREVHAASEKQVTYRVKGSVFDLQCRPDMWLPEGCSLSDGAPMIADLKTIAELPMDDEGHLSRHICNFFYHHAAWFYPEVVARVEKWKDEWFRPSFRLCFVEKEEPYAVVWREVDATALQVAEVEVVQALDRMKRCYETGVWPDSWDDKPCPTVGLPDWYVRKVLKERQELF